MIKTIIQHINNSTELSTELQKLTDEAFNVQELAEAVAAWFEQRYEEVSVEGIWGCNDEYERQLATLYESILQQAIANISSDQWLTIAEHLWVRYLIGRTAETMGFPN